MKFRLGIQPAYHDDVAACTEYMHLIKETGFDALFLPLYVNSLEHTKALCDAARETGLEIDELHAPFTNINYMWYDEPIGEPTLNMLKKSADICAACGVQKMVVHESSGRIGPDMSEKGFARYREFVIYCNERGVKPCFENLRRTNSLARIIERNRDMDIGYCWDSGHEFCYTPAIDHVALFGDLLACTHIHDNRGVYMCDDHVIPFDTDWESKALIIKDCGQPGVFKDHEKLWQRKAALIKKSGYDGILCLELARKNYPDLSDREFLRRAYAAITRFEEMCE